MSRHSREPQVLRCRCDRWDARLGCCLHQPSSAPPVTDAMVAEAWNALRLSTTARHGGHVDPILGSVDGIVDMRAFLKRVLSKEFPRG